MIFLPELEVSSNSTALLLKSNRIRGVLHPSSEKDRFLDEILYPLENALSNGNGTKTYTNVTFNRDVALHAVNSVTIQFEVDMTCNRKPTVQVVG